MKAFQDYFIRMDSDYYLFDGRVGIGRGELDFGPIDDPISFSVRVALDNVVRKVGRS